MSEQSPYDLWAKANELATSSKVSAQLIWRWLLLTKGREDIVKVAMDAETAGGYGAGDAVIRLFREQHPEETPEGQEE